MVEIEEISEMAWTIIGGLTLLNIILSFVGPAIGITNPLLVITPLVALVLTLLAGFGKHWEYTEKELGAIALLAIVIGMFAYGGGILGFSLNSIASQAGILAPIVTAFHPIATGLTIGLIINTIGGVVRRHVEG